MNQGNLDKIIQDNKSLKFEAFKDGEHVTSTVSPSRGDKVADIVNNFLVSFDMSKDALVSFELVNK